MDAGSICKRNVVSIDGKRSVQDAAMLMRERHVGALVVTAERPDGPMVIGIVTDRDLVVEALARGLDARLSVHLVAGTDLVSVPASASLDQIIGVMRQAGVRRVLVSTPDGQLQGILSFDDVVRAMAQQMAGLAETLHSGLVRETHDHPPLAMPSLEAAASQAIP